MYSDNITQKVAEAARKILTGQTVTEKLHPNQQKIDVVDDEKIDAKDFAKLRAMKKEEVEQIDELSKDTLKSYAGKVIDKTRTMPQGQKKQKHLTGLVNAMNKMKEEVEQVEEGIEDRLEAARAKAKAAGKPIKDKAPAAKSNVRKVEGSAYGGSKQKDEPEAEEDDTPAKKTVKYGARQNYTRSKRVNESFTQMVSDYKTEGLKFISESLIVEEPTEEEFNAEIEKAKAKSQGKDKAQVAKASVQAVKNEAVEQEIQVINADAANGVEQIDIEERSMSDAEMNKRETIVKSMKKGLSGFKERYGNKAKNVMYATATKQAMKN